MNNLKPYHCSLFISVAGRLEFVPNIIGINDDVCICKAFATIMSILNNSNADEVYVTFEKPEADKDVVFVDIWPNNPEQCKESIFNRRTNSTDLAVVMGILGSNNSREVLDKFENSKYTATLKIELVSII